MGKEYVTALYIRLSDEDNDLDETKTESGSILNQRNMLKIYVKNSSELSLTKVTEFVDDGYSGMNFERPAFKEMMQKVRAGNIHCIIVKDFSRLGRNYVEVGNLMEQIFPFLNIRFISVNDNYDSDFNQSTAGIEVGFKNLIYELYSKDLSKKIKKSKQMLANKGCFSGPVPPYGYKKSENDKHKLVIDEEAANNVRRIFAMAVDDYSCMEIAKIFNEEKMPSPMEYFRKASGKAPNKAKIFWSNNIVRKILSNECYLGKMIGGKSRAVGRRNKNEVVPKNERIIVENCHEPIVSYEEFYKANQKFNIKKGAYKKKDDLLFVKKIKCNGCGHYMYYTDESERSYYCHTALITNNASKCFDGKMKEKVIAEVVLRSITQAAKMAVEAREKLLKEKRDVTIDYASLIKAKESEIQRLKLSKITLFESFSLKKISDVRYKAETGKADEKLSTLERQLAELSLQKKYSAEGGNDFIDNFINYGDLEELNKEMVDVLVDSVIVRSLKKVEIIWNFKDAYIEAVKYLKGTDIFNSISSSGVRHNG